MNVDLGHSLTVTFKCLTQYDRYDRKPSNVQYVLSSDTASLNINLKSSRVIRRSFLRFAGTFQILQR